MRRGLARFRTGARSQSRHRQTVGGGQHLTSSLPRRSFSPNEPLEIARGPRAFPSKSHLQTRKLRAHLDGSQPAGSACVGNSIGPNEGPENARGSRAFPDGGPIAITRSASGWWGATSDKLAPQALVFFPMNRSKLREGLARFHRRPTCKRASYARIWMAANRSPLHAAGTRSAQMKGPKMRGGLARFRTEARSQSRHRQTVGGGQHLTISLPRRSFSPNEPPEIARAPRAFPAETRFQTRELRAHLDGGQPVGSACVGNAIGRNEGPENARGSRAFLNVGPIAITRSALGCWLATTDKCALAALVFSE